MNELDKMSIMTSDVIDLTAKEGVYRIDNRSQNKQDLTISKRNVKQKGTFTYLTKSQINSRLPFINDIRDKLFITLLWKTGIRVSEALSIEKQHVKPEQKRIIIRWLKSRRYREREVNAPDDVINQLMIFSRSLKYDEKLFQFSRQRAEQITKQEFGVSPHVFRHSFAMNWVDQELPIDVLQRQLGHRNIQTTMKYIHASGSRVRKYMDQIQWE